MDAALAIRNEKQDHEKRDQELGSLIPPGVENWEMSAEEREVCKLYMGEEELEELLEEEALRPLRQQMLEEAEKKWLEEWLGPTFQPPPEQS
jgi:hypothetical protein